MLVLSRYINETIMIGDDIEVTIVDIKGDQVRIGIKAPRDIKVYRKEIYEAIAKENIDAANVKNVNIKDLETLINKSNPQSSGEKSSDDSKSE
ncbi:MAG: carbon storage regulator [Planctomycetota bacterium]|nr:MAG: carbon storage regulator [Planctomycetota bacterium]